MKSIAIIILLVLFSGLAIAQKKDTITITAQNIKTSNLKPGVNRYLVYFKNGKDSNSTKFQLWTRKVEYVNYHGKNAISISQQWVDNDTVVHKVSTICDKQTFQTLFHEAWWKGFGSFSFDFENGKAIVQGKPLDENDTVAQRKRIFTGFKTALSDYFSNWHLDLETFAMLPLKENTTYRINFYDPGLAPPKYQFYTVTGSATLNGHNTQQIDCWLLTYEAANSKEVFWISKKTNEVLYLEQKFGDKYRYKEKLSF